MPDPNNNDLEVNQNTDPVDASKEETLKPSSTEPKKQELKSINVGGKEIEIDVTDFADKFVQEGPKRSEGTTYNWGTVNKTNSELRAEENMLKESFQRQAAVENHDNVLNVAGKVTGTIFYNTAAMLFDTVGSLDVGDWRVPGGNKAGNAVNSAFKYIDNTIGDGENTFGNWFTRRAAKDRLVAQNWYTVNTGNSNWDYFWNVSGSVVGSLAGAMLSGGGIAKLAQYASAPQKVQKLVGAILMTNATAFSIAEDTQKKVYTQTLEKLSPEFKSELEQIKKDAYTKAIKAGKSPEDAEWASMEAADVALIHFAGDNPLLHEKAAESAARGVDAAIGATMPSFFLNIGTAGLFSRGHKAITRANLAKPSVLGTAKEMGGEALQEGVEEGLIETLAGDIGEKYGMTGKYSLDDATKAIFSKQALESALIGAIAGGGTAGIAQGISYKNRKEQYDKQQEAIKEWNKIGAAVGQPELLDNLTSVHKSMQEVTRLAKQQQELVRAGKEEEAKQIGDKILAVQAFNAFKTKTTGELIENYEKILNDESVNDEMKGRVLEGITMIKEMEKVYQKATLKYRNASDVFTNRVNDYTLDKLKKELETQVTEKKIEASGVIQSALKAGSMSLGSTKSVIVDNDEYNQTVKTEQQDITLSYDLDNLETNSYEGNDKKVYGEFLNKAKEQQSVKELMDLQERLNAVEENINENNNTYNKITSKKFQTNLKRTNKLATRLLEFQNKPNLAEQFVRFTKGNKKPEKNSPLYYAIIDQMIDESNVDKPTKQYLKNKFALDKIAYEIERQQTVDNAVQSVTGKIENKQNESIEENPKVAPPAAADEKLNNIAIKIKNGQPLTKEETTFKNQFTDQIKDKIRELQGIESKSKTDEGKSEELHTTGNELINVTETENLFDTDENTVNTDVETNTEASAKESVLSTIDDKFSGTFTQLNIKAIANELGKTSSEVRSIISDLVKDGRITKDGKNYTVVKLDGPSDTVQNYLSQFKNEDPLTGDKYKFPQLTINDKTLDDDAYEQLLKDLEWFRNNGYTVTSVGSTHIISNKNTGTPTNTDVEQESFEPKELKKDISQDAKDKIASLIEDYVEFMKSENKGKMPTFEEFVRSYIRNVGREQADTYFKMLSSGWGWNNYPAADYGKVYNSLFRDEKQILDNLNALMQENIMTDDEVREYNEEDHVDEIAEKEVVDIDEDNNPRFEHLTITTDNSAPKFGYSSRKAKQVFSEDKFGDQDVMQVDYEYADENLNENSIVKHQKLLDPDKFNPGEELEIVVFDDDQLATITVPVYDTDPNSKRFNTKIGTELYGEYLARKIAENPNFKETQEYQDTLPMFIKDSEGDIVAQVHEPRWYNESKFRGNIEEARSNTRIMRKNALNALAKGKKAGIKIIKKTGGNIVRIPSNKPAMTLSEANPEAEFGLVEGNTIMVNGVPFEGTLINGPDFFEQFKNRPVDIRRWGVDEEGNPTYRAYPVFMPLLNSQQINTVAMFIKTYLMRDYFPGYKKLDFRIQDITGDERPGYPRGLDFLMKKFIMVNSDNYTKGNLDPVSIGSFMARSKADMDGVPSGLPYYFSQGGKLIFGIADGSPAIVLSKEEFENRNNNEAFAKLQNVIDNILPEFKLNYHKNYSNQPAFHVDLSGNINQVSPAGEYGDYLKSFANTNIKSHNIGTVDNPKWVTRVQPSIYFDSLEPTARKVQESKTEVTEEKKQTTEAVIETTTDEELKEAVIEAEATGEFDFQGTTLDEKVEDAKELLKEDTGEKIDFVEEHLEGKVETTVTDIEAKKADIERRRQEELKKEAHNITIKQEEITIVDNDGNFNVSFLSYKKDGSVVVKQYDDEGTIVYEARLKPGYSQDQFDFAIGTKYLEKLEGDKESTLITVPIKSRKNLNFKGSEKEAKINAKYDAEYDAELAALESQQEVVTISEEEYNKILKQAEAQVKWVNEYFDNDFNESYDPVELTDEDTKEMVKGIFKIPGLSPLHQEQMIDFIFNKVSDFATFEKAVEKSQIRGDLEVALGTLLAENKAALEATLDKLNTLPENQQVTNLKNKYNKALDKIKLVEENASVLVEEGLNKLMKYTGVTESKMKESTEDRADEESEIEDASSEKEDNYSKTSLEENGKNSMTYRLKRFMAGMKDTNPKTGLANRGAMGVPLYVPFDHVTDKVRSILSDTPLDFKTMMDVLEQHSNAEGWIPELISKLRNADNEIKNAFVSNMGNHALKMEFVMYSFDQKNNRMSLKVMNTNSAAVQRKITDNWKNTLLNDSPLVIVENGEYKTNVEAAKELYEQYKSWYPAPQLQGADSVIYVKSLIRKGIGSKKSFVELDDSNRSKALKAKMKNATLETKAGNKYFSIKIQNNKLYFEEAEDLPPIGKALNNYAGLEPEVQQQAIDDLHDWFRSFGISLSDNVIHKIFADGIFTKGKQLNAKAYFKESADTEGVVGLFANWLNGIVNGGTSTDITNEDIENVNPLRNSAVEKTLSKLQARFEPAIVTNSFRDGKKSIYGFTAFKYITDRVAELKNNPKMLEELRSLSFSKGSVWLDFLENAKLKENFSLSHLGLTAIKEQGKKVYKDNGITKLSDADHELVKLAMFMDMKLGSTTETYGKGKDAIKLRAAKFLFPTMSDKSTMTVMQTYAFDLFNQKYYKINPENNIIVTSEVENLLFDQLVNPELERIVNFKHNVKSTNIKNYDKGAMQFLALPHLNDISVEINGDEIKLHEFLNSTEPYTKEDVVNTFGAKIRQELQNYVRTLVDEKLTVWNNNGYQRTDKNGKYKSFFDHKYMSRKSIGTLDPVKFAAYDYVINQLIANSNAFQTIIGDPAMYYKSKADSFIEQSKDTYVNVGKRLAAMIAPGSKLADSQNEVYTQIFLEDRVDLSENLNFLTTLLDNKAFDAEEWNRINSIKIDGKTDLEKNQQKKEKKALLDAFMDQYPNSADYFGIESTDAQEYTTWKEHLHILEKMGRTPDVAVGIKPEEIRVAKEMFASGTPIDKMTPQQKSVLKKVMQPIKPVYTGQLYDSNQDAMRMMYIKSSSFPLIPQLTKGLELDKLRVALQNLEDSSMKNGVPTRYVRASYQSGNKVGAHNKPLQIFDNSGKIKNLSNNDLKNASLELNRKDFKIQLDVPYKSYKKKEDTVSVGTQLTKLLFGDNIMGFDDTSFKLDGENVSGAELERRYTDSFMKLGGLRKKALLKELGINPITKQPYNVKTTAKKVQKLLKDEASSRGYSQQDIESLEIEYIKDTQGEIVDYKFKMPLWMSANSNRFESLLNAIVTNRLVKFKFPGSSYVVGSEEGFRFQSNLDGVDKSKIVWTSKWHGKLQAAKFDNENKFVQGQILAPSKFRNKEGRLIDLLEKDEKGNYKYVVKTESGFKLNENKFDADLLSITSFRVPTSGLMSAAQLEIVGFLPQESGDLMIVPKNLMVQKGIDFDIDKETTYQLWHTENEKGEFKKIKEEDPDFVLQTLDEQYKRLESIEQGLDELKVSRAELDIIYDEAKDRAELGFGQQAAFKFSELKEKSKEYKEDKKALKEAYKEVVQNIAILNKLLEKSLMNDIISIHKAVLTSNSPGVQKKINKVLSISFAKEQAEKIDKIISGNKDETYFTPLSDEYQKQKMFLGASGKIGVGAYSLDVTSHSLFEQAKAKGNPLTLMTGQDEPFTLQFGSIRSEGKLGESKALLPNKRDFIIGRLRQLNTEESSNLIKLLQDNENFDMLFKGQATINEDYNRILEDYKKGQRPISEVLAERQNIATDNEKEQVMGKVNLNSMTLDVDKVLCMLGFDKAEDGDSIAFLFLSQPIIKEYVAKMSNASSNIAEYSPDKENIVVDELFEKYGLGGFPKRDPNFDASYGPLMTNRALLDGIETEGADQMMQVAFLNRFLMLKDYGIAIRNVQTAINTDSKGLGKSVAETSEKINTVAGLFTNDMISNTGNLLGEVAYASQMTLDEIDAAIADGYERLGDSELLIKPTTINGMFTVNALNTANDLWSKHFPYNSPVAQTIFERLLPLIAGEEAGESKKAERKQLIFKEIKKFINAYGAQDLITKDIQAERERLFFDREGKQSLSSYLQEQMKNSNVLKTNKLLQRFEFSQDKANEGKPSTIFFNNTAQGNFDEGYLNTALLSLMERNVPLASFNGEVYSTRKLAQDLITYSLLEGGVQEAVQFHKFVPLRYLEKLGFVHSVGNIDFANDFDLFGLDPENKAPSTFEIQFAQHNPLLMPSKDTLEVVKGTETITKEGVSKEQLNDGVPSSFKVTKDSPKHYFVNTRKNGNSYLYRRVNKDTYILIPTRGSFGMSEYTTSHKETKSITSSITPSPVQQVEIKKKEEPTHNAATKASRFGLQNNSIVATILSVADGDYGYISQLAKTLTSVVDSNVQIKVDNIKQRGKFHRGNNVITIDKSWAETATDQELATTVMKEIVHSITDKELLKYTDAQGNLQTSRERVPAYIRTLTDLFGKVKRIPEFKERLDVIRQAMANEEGLFKTDKRVYYGGYDILEFVEMMMTQPEFQQKMSEIKVGNKSLLDRFKDFLTQMFNSLGLKFESDTVAAQAVDAILELVEAKKEGEPKIEPTKAVTKTKDGTFFDAKKVAQLGSMMNSFLEGDENIDYVTPNPSDFNGYPELTKLMSEPNLELGSMEYEFMRQHPEMVENLIKEFEVTTMEDLYDKVTNMVESNNLDRFLTDTSSINDDVKTDEDLIREANSKPEMKKYELFPGVYANKEQVVAIDAGLDFLSGQDDYFVIKGRGGTGKTTIIKKIIQEHKKQHGSVSVVGATIAHQARKVLQRSLGKSTKTATLASMLGKKEQAGKWVTDKWFKPERSPLATADIIIIDETSMISNSQLRDIISFKEEHNPSLKIIFMGDNVQLPPIDEGQDSKTFDVAKPENTVELKERMRQGEDSPIVPITDILAANVESQNPQLRVLQDRNSKFNPTTNEGVLFTDEANVTPEMERDFKDEPYDTKIVVYRNATKSRLDNKVRQIRFGEAAQYEINVGEVLTSRGNNAEQQVYNGEYYIVQSVKPVANAITIPVYMGPSQIGSQVLDGYEVVVLNEDGKEMFLTIPKPSYSDKTNGIIGKSLLEIRNQINKGKLPHSTWKETFYQFTENNVHEMEYGYAISSHKAQGSTFNNVYAYEDDILSVAKASVKAKNQSLYVATSRPRKKLVIVSNQNTTTKLSELQMEVDMSLLPPPIEPIEIRGDEESLGSFEPKELSDIERESGLRNTDGSRKRYTKESAALAKAKEFNSGDTNYVAKVIKVMGEKGDTRVYHAVKIEPRKVKTEVLIPKYEINRKLSNADGSKRFAQTNGVTITLNPVSSVQEFFDYFEGKEERITSEQKALVLEELEKQGWGMDRIKSLLNTKKLINTFLILHEQSHIASKDKEVYWKQGRDMLSPDKIQIETRASVEALQAIEGSQKPQSLADMKTMNKIDNLIRKGLIKAKCK